MNMTLEGIERILSETLNQLHQKGLNELEAYVSLGMDTGIRPTDLETIERKNIVGNTVKGVKCNKFNNEYAEQTLSKRTLELLQYLPEQGRLFPLKSYQYRNKIKNSINGSEFLLHSMRQYWIYTKCLVAR